MITSLVFLNEDGLIFDETPPAFDIKINKSQSLNRGAVPTILGITIF